MIVEVTIVRTWTIQRERSLNMTQSEVNRHLASHRTPEDLPNVMGHINRISGIKVQNVKNGSLSVTMECQSSAGLEELWSDYRSGKLNELFEKDIITDDVLTKANAVKIPLKTTIPSYQYKKCKSTLKYIEEGILPGEHVETTIGENQCGICKKEMPMKVTMKSDESSPEAVGETGIKDKIKSETEDASEQSGHVDVKREEQADLETGTDLVVLSVDPAIFDKTRVEKVISKIHNESVKAGQEYKVKAKGIDEVNKVIRNVAVLHTKSAALLKELITTNAAVFSLIGVRKVLALNKDQQHCISGKVIHKHIIDDLFKEGIDIQTPDAHTDDTNLASQSLFKNQISEKDYLEVVTNLVIENTTLKESNKKMMKRMKLESEEMHMFEVKLSEKESELEVRMRQIQQNERELELLTRSLLSAKTQHRASKEEYTVKVSALEEQVKQSEKTIEEIQTDMKKCKNLLTDVYNLVKSYELDKKTEVLVSQVKTYLLESNEKLEDMTVSPEEEELQLDQKPKSWTDLHVAALNGDSKLAKKLLEAGTEHLDVTTEEGFTALHIATSNNHMDVIKCLVQAKAKLDIKDKDENTALHLACKNKHFNIVMYLIESGADKNARDKNDNNALHLASISGKTEVVKYLLQHGMDKNAVGAFKRSALLLSAGKGHLETVKYLIGEGLDPNDRDEQDNNALHVASLFGKTEVVKYLLQHGMDKNAVGMNKETPLHKAALNGHTEVIKVLLAAGADQDIVNMDNKTARTTAIERGHSNAAKALMRK